MDLKNMAEEIHNLFLEKNMTLSFAESCTGGLLSESVTQFSGASKYFLGSVVSYSGQVKMDLLKVPESLIVENGEVSIPVAEKMAEGAKEVLKTDWSLSVTGIAGPGGGSEEKPVGTVCFGVNGPGFEFSEKVLINGEDRKQIQNNSAVYGLGLLKLGIQS